MDTKLERLLTRSAKPARYTGGEYGQIVKEKANIDLRMALCFPDTYEIGMSNLGAKILYGVINALDGVWCERVFAPWGDFEDGLRREGIALYALESGDAIGQFDAIGFSLGYELSYTTVLNMLNLAGLPVKSADRPSLLPLVFAGGTACVNPEPMADFLDLMVVGEGEEVSIELLELLRRAKREDWEKARFLSDAANIEGIYVPSLYNPVYNADGTISQIEALPGAPEKVTKRIAADFENSFYPTTPVVPSTEIVHDRVVLELFRGCVRGCRFCQAGFAYRPVRSRSAEKCIEYGVAALENTGYQEISLSSLSTSDYRGLNVLCDGLLDYCEPRGIGLSLPSLRADNFSISLMERAQKVRRSGLTFAPEAGTQRLRDVINKNVREEDLLESLRIAFEGGWNTVKLYFMLGLPTETDEDVLGIAALAEKVLKLWKKTAKNKTRGVKITVSTSCFIPKPHTPFQWEAQVSPEEYMRRVTLLRDNLRTRAITYNWHGAEESVIEAVLSRGDRRLGAVIEEVWKNGGRLEAWSEYFSYERWMQALQKFDLTAQFYAARERHTAEVLPWSRVDLGVKPAYLMQEREQALAGRVTPDCRSGCSDCGAGCLLEGGLCDGRA
ncbi:MAG: TIGR03960 family B12-binding radical SAM protein [Oscillospiraceae bacterium]|nr:TIGR03960 family B12-binding radical SAM protein [Oscillospiraceae bacterium]